MAEKIYHTGKKAPKKITGSYLENAALHYLQRYATSAANLRRILLRKVKKSCDFHQMPADEFTPMVDALVARYAASGLIDDTVFARGRVATLRRLGLSKQAIMAKLGAKGLSEAQISAALAEIDSERDDADPELSAARAYARRKKLGPYRSKPATDETRQKELASLGRAGFSYETARRALEQSEDADD